MVFLQFDHWKDSSVLFPYLANFDYGLIVIYVKEVSFTLFTGQNEWVLTNILVHWCCAAFLEELRINTGCDTMSVRQQESHQQSFYTCAPMITNAGTLPFWTAWEWLLSNLASPACVAKVLVAVSVPSMSASAPMPKRKPTREKVHIIAALLWILPSDEGKGALEYQAADSSL